ncbi:Protein of unknown function [Pedobacter westerhofensis]|uniref:DUF2931 family protein n=1 Tax=Pedobacter westerhofensis TaxID=425512 RepID=A0A521CYQ1_9SPHI|nr:DUF2931 family protein [Pedobacter westerhofensis]SMO64576.1 Protein of unknown function [Pedobacter westerhofensis]
MYQLNSINKIYAAILMLLILATSVKIWKYKTWKRYYYTASFSSPASYPVHVHNGQLILEDGEIAYVGYNTVNDGNNFGWGYGDSNDPTRKERLPVKLVVQYASFRDQSFYSDTIPLPVDAIKKAFSTVNAKGISTDLYQKPSVNRLDFVIGIANKGNIIVWLRGENFEETLLKHKIAPHEPSGDETYDETRLTKSQYLKTVFWIDSAKLETFKAGLDKDASYIDTPSQFKIRLKQ